MLLAALMWPVLARAQSASPARCEEVQTNELNAALIDPASLNLPVGCDFIPKAEGARILLALGNTVNESTFVGLIVGTKPGDEWIVVTRHEGYINDDDARHWP